MTIIVTRDNNRHKSLRAAQSSYPVNMLVRGVCQYVGEDLERSPYDEWYRTGSGDDLGAESPRRPPIIEHAQTTQYI